MSELLRATIALQDDSIEMLKKRIEELEAVVDGTRPFFTWIYNQGYGQGHHDTVESMYTDVLPVDAESYHDDIVADLLGEYAALYVALKEHDGN